MKRGKGMEGTGKKTPQRKIIGNRKKFDMVIASKTSFTPTEIRIPRREKARPEKMKMRTNAQKYFTENPMSGIRMRVMKTATISPKRVLPSVLPKRMVLKFNGARRSLSRAPILFSKVITMAAIEVHEKRRVNPIKPGTTSLIPAGFLK
jgi:hypothetical protein